MCTATQRFLPEELYLFMFVIIGRTGVLDLHNASSNFFIPAAFMSQELGQGKCVIQVCHKHRGGVGGCDESSEAGEDNAAA